MSGAPCNEVFWMVGIVDDKINTVLQGEDGNVGKDSECFQHAIVAKGALQWPWSN